MAIKVTVDTSKAVEKLGHIEKDIDKGLRKEASRLASMANKRIQRLEKNNLTDLPAYKAWADNGAVKFGIKGKQGKDLRKEMSRMRNFLNAKSSTVKGSNALLREIANNTGIKYKNLTDLKTKTKPFFDIAGKLKDYYKSKDNPMALDYQKIWQQIDEYVDDEDLQLSNDMDLDAIDGIVEDIANEYYQSANNVVASAVGDSVFQDID